MYAVSIWMQTESGIQAEWVTLLLELIRVPEAHM